MPKPDDADDAAARLPQRATPGASTRTDTRALPSPTAPTREHTSVTRPLFTADDSAEDDDSGDDDATDFDALATVAEVQALPAIDAATRISSGRQPDLLVRNDVDSQIDGQIDGQIDAEIDSEEADAIDEHAVTRAVDTAALARVARDDRDDEHDEEPVAPDERTMVSVVVPDHLRDGGMTMERSLERGDRTIDAGDDEVSALLASAPPSVHGERDDLEPRSTELMPRTASRIVEAPVSTKPAWLTGAVVFGAIVVVVIIVLAIAFAAR